MQLVSSKRLSLEIEVMFAGVTKVVDITQQGSRPSIVLADSTVEQQVVPPSKYARAFDDELGRHARPLQRKN